jgi:hypothetical protein
MTSSINQAKSLLQFCEANPRQRFWQAVRNWAGVNYVGVSNDRVEWIDTFHFSDDVAREYPDG